MHASEKLFQAIDNGSVDEAIKAIEEGADVNCSATQKGYSCGPVMENGHYVTYADPKVAKEKGAEVEWYTFETSCLFYAIEKRRLEIIKLLIKKGADCTKAKIKRSENGEVLETTTFNQALKENGFKIKKKLFGKKTIVEDTDPNSLYNLLNQPNTEIVPNPTDVDTFTC